MVIGIFAGVGSGKSTVLNILRDEYDAYIIEADRIAHELYIPGNEGYGLVTGLLGNAVLTESGELDRKKMADILYSDRALLEKLNSLIHPLVWKTVKKLVEENRESRGLIFVEAALLPDSCKNSEKSDIYDKIWYVYTSEGVRTERLARSRGYTAQKIRSVMDAQPKEQEYRELADEVLDNNGSIENLRESIAAILKKYEVQYEICKHCKRQQRQFGVSRKREYAYSDRCRSKQ